MYRIDWRNWKTSGADFWHVRKFLAWFGQVLVLETFFTHLTKLWRNCHIFESVKNHINAYILHPIRDRNVKTYYDMYLYDRNLKYTNHHQIVTSSWCYKIWKNMKFGNFQFPSHSRCTKYIFESNNRKAVVVSEKHVVKWPSKRSSLVRVIKFDVLRWTVIHLWPKEKWWRWYK